MLSVFWTPSHLELYFFDRQDLFTVSDIHEQMGADIRSKDTESSSNCSGTSHMLCFFFPLHDSRALGILIMPASFSSYMPPFALWFMSIRI
jgi:hypothetical protein